jgi:hypothetical protein
MFTVIPAFWRNGANSNSVTEKLGKLEGVRDPCKPMRDLLRR